MFDIKEFQEYLKNKYNIDSLEVYENILKDCLDKEIKLLLFLEKNGAVLCEDLLAKFSGEDYDDALEILMAEGYITRTCCIECPPYDGSRWDSKATLTPRGRSRINEYRRDRRRRNLEILIAIAGFIGTVVAIIGFFL